MRFKRGDKVVCIRLNGIQQPGYIEHDALEKIKLDKTYTVQDIGYNYNSLTITLDEIYFKYGKTYFYNAFCFKILSEVRKQKIKTLKNEF
jgi:hypothetical protein